MKLLSYYYYILYTLAFLNAMFLKKINLTFYRTNIMINEYIIYI